MAILFIKAQLIFSAKKYDYPDLQNVSNFIFIERIC